jgi:hypothetical protein
MGLLDDAIREHLDLKRRRGADPTEIAREEDEALGPVRRSEPSASAPAAEVADSPHADGYEHDHEPAALEDPAGAYADEVYADEPAAYAADLDPEPERHDDAPVPADPPQTHTEPYAERESETATPPHGDPLLHQPTREFSAHELDEALGEEPAPAPAADREGGGEDEDVLEETPDFLQETPEHDRLWFEQKPPKDFDF